MCRQSCYCSNETPQEPVIGRAGHDYRLVLGGVFAIKNSKKNAPQQKCGQKLPENGLEYSRKRRNTGRKPKINSRVQRAIPLLAEKEGCSSRKIMETLLIDVRPSQIRNLLSKQHHYRYQKPVNCPPLTDEHRKIRTFGLKLTYILMTKCEKKQCYPMKKVNFKWARWFIVLLAQYKNCKRVRISRQSGGGSVMIWGAFSWFGTSQLVFLSERQNADLYCISLEQYLVQFIGFHLKKNHYNTFQQDNASIHTTEQSSGLATFQLYSVYGLVGTLTRCQPYWEYLGLPRKESL